MKTDYFKIDKVIGRASRFVNRPSGRRTRAARSNARTVGKGRTEPISWRGDGRGEKGEKELVDASSFLPETLHLTAVY